MGVTREIGQDLLGPAKGFWHRPPIRSAQRREVGCERVGVLERAEIGEELKLSCCMQSLDSFQNRRRNRRESTRTARKKPRLQAIQRLPSGDSPPPGTMQCRWG